ncbi:2,3-dihydro-2,3-dihydroxybenzoate dehydrogenase [Amycolatopsis sp. WAC 01375]|uniref:2,3-dihydro-2,3-dihydroxybenzoate dehydrogenase n=1 Tax=unclassified Amycolatopsis TaxID=2618356 RepID=UPI000F7A17D8|nr:MULTISPECIES: 2,3-dihydro-2,3-dihydroxybenzoate dehydrogenase [unclassified Amycolatopsis]RSM79778.1 2,3-dihydro-2,3-dihydroxybenzoate dehydrogenase [Amycolatopsis sp. WAC 01375]RSN27382.1 2,3-dihydro-2,3-dihydroxybenzoate dehydrogenase [Amycolatopsis sp. WAC 01416]
MEGIEGKVALVTGGARGIGAAVVDGLVGAGAIVAAVDLTEGPSRDGVTSFVADVGDPAAVARVVDDIERELGPIGIGASVAGVLKPGSVCETSDEDWAATFAVNSTGVFTVLREISRRMLPRRSGVLVTVGSNAAGVPRAGMAAYAASKAAATMLTRCLGLELAGSGIRCNIVSPGSTDTEMQRLLWTDENGADLVIAGNLEQYRVGIPLGRIAEPADIADAVLFLASDRARHITMQNLYVDGGATLRG